MASLIKNKRVVIIPGIVILTALLIYILSRDENPGAPQIDPTRPAFLDQRDGQAYTVLYIGSQTWMGENLRATVLNDATPLKLIKDGKEWSASLVPAYCYYNNKRSDFMYTYGPLYNWFAVNTGKLCPVGWHVPSKADWEQLFKFTGDSINFIRSGDSTVFTMGTAGDKLKETGNMHWKFNDSIRTTDNYRFTALPGGERTVYGLFWGTGEQGSWWTSDEEEYQKTDAKNIEMRFENRYVTKIQQYKKSGMSVRCIKDK